MANPFRASQTAQLTYPSDDTRLLAALARATSQALYRPGHAYLKAVVGLIEIPAKRHQQIDLLQAEQNQQADRLMAVMDQVICREGRGTVFLASQGTHKPWFMRQSYRSPQYTTRWCDIPEVHV